MILDNFLLLSGALSAAGVLTGQAVNGAGNFVSTNSIDTGPNTIGNNQPSDLGNGEPLAVIFNVLSAPTGGTNVKFEVISATDAALTAGVQVLSSSPDYTIAQLPINTLIGLQIESQDPLLAQRYIGVRYVTTGAIATFSVSAAVVMEYQTVRNLVYRSGFTVL